MSIDPVKEWQRFSQLYGEKSNQELTELSASLNDLTKIAQSFLIENRNAIRDHSEWEDMPSSEVEEVPWILRENCDAQVGELNR